MLHNAAGRTPDPDDFRFSQRRIKGYVVELHALIPVVVLRKSLLLLDYL